jgi:hypothetical protein
MRRPRIAAMVKASQFRLEAIVMATYVHSRSALVPHVVRQGAWFVFGSVVAFGIPYVGVSLLDLEHDLYYGAYFAITLAMLAAYVRSEHVDVRALFTRNWIWSLAVGVPVAAFVVWNVFRTDDATARPHGAYFAFEILWRGVGYGTIDALLLTVFPCVVTYSMLRGHIRGVVGRARSIAIALPMILVITAAYHLGYPQYRQDGIAKPEIGNTLISIPMLATANPIGSIGAHVSMHVTAVTHSYETTIFLPPKTDS